MRPHLACTNCRIRKKKCNRAFPACSYCLKTHDRCSYRAGNNAASLLATIAIEPPGTNDSHIRKSTPWVESLFLDANLFRLKYSFAASHHRAVDPALRQTLEGDTNQQEWLTKFVESIDSWMSIISYPEIRETFSRPVALLNGEEVTLLACIRLHTIAISEENPRSTLYHKIKSSLVSAEVHGALSLRLLQAQILVLFYEFGHGIYPSAYFTLGCCIHYLAALGIDEKDLQQPVPRTWIESELRRRLWWAVFVMERCIALGNAQRPLSMPEPNRNTALPSDDESWKRQYPLDQANATLATQLTLGMGNFRLLALTSHLLGQVIKHQADPPLEQSQRRDMILQLYRTTLALDAVVEEEARLPIMLVGAPRSLLNSAKMLLFSDNSPAIEQLPSESPRAISAALFLERSQMFLRRKLVDVSRSSPFLLHWGYHALDHFYYLYRQDGRMENNQAIQVLEETFHQLERRWRLTNVYMTLIHARYMS